MKLIDDDVPEGVNIEIPDQEEPLPLNLELATRLLNLYLSEELESDV